MSDPVEPQVVVEHGDTTTAVISGVVPMTELASFFDRSFTSLAATLGEQDIAITGPAYARYHGRPTDTADLEVGFPTVDPVEPADDVRPGTLPAGRVARLVHHGAYDRLGEAWGRLESWIAEQGLTPGPVLWETYVTEPSPEMDPADLRTELSWTLA